jgi:hypothetical protein
MRKLLLLLVCAAVAAPTAGASAPTSLVVRPNGPTGPLVLFDLGSLRTKHRLPAGLASADGRSFLAARVPHADTVLWRYALPSGRMVGRGVVRGRYVLAAVSADGTRAVLADFGGGVTRFVVVKAPRWQVEHRVALRGSYAVEALSPDGRRLFLVRYGRGGYSLRLYDTATRRLRPTPLAEGAAAQPKMAGTAWRSVATRDGRWLLTLYVKPYGGAFVHALGLAAGVGHCVDLPVGEAGFKLMSSASLALSRDARRLYVATPTLGRVFELDVYPPRVVRDVRFPATPRGRGDGLAAVSPGGGTLAFVSAAQLWRYDIETRTVSAPVSAPSNVAGLGFATDGRRVVAVDAHGRATLIA